jgi:hypothetical protein
MRVERAAAKIAIFLSLAVVQTSAAYTARAQGAYLYSVAANDGYGLQDCLAGGAECGQVVADSWCEAHGHGKALSFGPASRFSSSVMPVSTAPESYVISCGD